MLFKNPFRKRYLAVLMGLEPNPDEPFVFGCFRWRKQAERFVHRANRPRINDSYYFQVVKD